MMNSLREVQVGQTADIYFKRDFWADENLQYRRPHFRLEKAARLVNKRVGRRACDLLDVGCGPAALMPLLSPNIRYHGIDIAIHQPAANLIEADFVQQPIAFNGKRFDVIVAQGVFEYIGTAQSQKFQEIAQLLKEGGTFLVSYVNFNHRSRDIYWLYNNVQPSDDFKRGLEQFFHVDRFFPTSQRWHHVEPTGGLMKALQMHIKVNIPFVSRMLAVEYFFICSPLRRGKRL